MKEQASNYVSRKNRPTGSRIRRTLKVKIKKSKPILGIAIEGGYNVSGQLLPRIVCVHEDGAAYECGMLRASDLILEVNGESTVNMTHDDIAKTIANAYYQDTRNYIEFLVGENVVE